MKRIPLKKVAVTSTDGKEDTLDYKVMLEFIVRNPGDSTKRGMDITEIRNSLRVLDVLEKAEGEWADFEDADYAFMIGKVHEARFGIVHHAIVQFVDDVTGAT